MSMSIDKNKAIGNLKEIQEKMYSDTDISIFREYHKLYRKEISFFKRSWAAAWLFMYYDKRETPNLTNIENQINLKGRKTKTVPEKPSVEYHLSAEESKRLFISIGKNRRLFPREVITLIMSNTSAAREDVGMIKILDSYSFVQVRDTKADEIIEKLSGFKFRGRTLSVNYAKPKTSEADMENN
ncbi:MAG: DbpA RNA binding domain-containing protein [Treponema sp.]|nr:DbpA RNA binding domain-containing protein [Treponema sp.]